MIAYAAFWIPSEPHLVLEGKKKLLELDGLLTRITSMSQLSEHFSALLNLLTYIDFKISEPICATAIVLWLKHNLFDDEFYEWTSFTLGETPLAFHILDEIAINHASHRSRVFDIWISLFERNFDMLSAKIATLVVVNIY